MATLVEQMEKILQEPEEAAAQYLKLVQDWKEQGLVVKPLSPVRDDTHTPPNLPLGEIRSWVKPW